MKKYLLSLLATVAFVGCGSKDDDTPAPPQRPDFTQAQQNYLPTKKVKHITATYLEEDENTSYNSVEYTDFLNPTIPQGLSFTLKNLDYQYEYDSAGRINKITFKSDDDLLMQSTFVYSDNSVTVTSPPPYDGIREPRTIEYGFNLSGNMLGIGMYNEKQQLKNSMSAGTFVWENDNLTKINRKTMVNGVEGERGLSFSYNTAVNKNMFYLIDFAGDELHSYQEYFAHSIGFIKGKAPKNLPTKIVPLEKNYPYSDFKYPIEFSYTFDSDNFVKTIAEKELKHLRAGVHSYIYIENDANTYWGQLQTLIAGIENKTITDKTYNLISDKDNTLTFQITIPMKAEKDSKGNTINLNMNKVCEFSVRYTTENNKKKAESINMSATYYAEITTNYELNY
ncbi:hypothetical protein RCZ04_02270 [Capnocytophaga sp. HP1101]